MSHPMNGVAILRAIKGVVAGELGSVRKVVDPGGSPLVRYSPSVIEAEDPLEERLFMGAGHWFSIRPPALRDHPSTPPTKNSNQEHVYLEVVIEGLSSGGQNQDFTIDMQGEVLNVARAVRSALGFPRNLTVDDRGQQTGIVSGCLVSPNGVSGNPVAQLGERDCHLMRWRVSGVAILDLIQAVT